MQLCTFIYSTSVCYLRKCTFSNMWRNFMDSLNCMYTFYQNSIAIQLLFVVPNLLIPPPPFLLSTKFHLVLGRKSSTWRLKVPGIPQPCKGQCLVQLRRNGWILDPEIYVVLQIVALLTQLISG